MGGEFGLRIFVVGKVFVVNGLGEGLIVGDVWELYKWEYKCK